MPPEPEGMSESEIVGYSMLVIIHIFWQYFVATLNRNTADEIISRAQPRLRPRGIDQLKRSRMRSQSERRLKFDEPQLGQWGGWFRKLSLRIHSLGAHGP